MRTAFLICTMTFLACSAQPTQPIYEVSAPGWPDNPEGWNLKIELPPGFGKAMESAVFTTNPVFKANDGTIELQLEIHKSSFRIEDFTRLEIVALAKQFKILEQPSGFSPSGDHRGLKYKAIDKDGVYVKYRYLFEVKKGIRAGVTFVAPANDVPKVGMMNKFVKSINIELAAKATKEP